MNPEGDLDPTTPLGLTVSEEAGQREHETPVVVFLSRCEAIAVAEAILTGFDVPFVPAGGVLEAATRYETAMNDLRATIASDVEGWISRLTGHGKNLP